MIREKTTPKEIIIDLTGPSGNAFVLMGHARSFAKQLGYSKDDTDALIRDMMAGDYENLLQVFDKHFPFVVLER
jgi:hypothetical protein